MATLNNLRREKPVKMLLLGDSGTGKTGALGSLVRDASQELLMYDFDNGLSILGDAKVIPPTLASKVHYQTFTDKYKTVGAKTMIDGVPKAWSESLKQLTHWRDGDEDLGQSSTWGTDKTIVIDSLTFWAKAAMNHILMLNGRMGQRPYQSDWGEAQDLVEGALSLLYSKDIKCNVVVNCHIAYIPTPETADKENPILRGLPMSLGKALSPKIPRYFDVVVQARTKGQGAQTKRVILTQPTGGVELKLPVLEGLPSELPLDTGLATIFNHLLKE